MFHLYGMFIGIAIVAGCSVAERVEPKIKAIAPWVIIFGIIGARIYHVADFWDYYSLHVNEILMLWKGGLSIWGGLIGGYVAFQFTIYNIQFTKKEKWESIGAMVTALPLAQAIGRLGNAVNGEFVNKVWIFPWWGAEAILDLILFGILCLLQASHVSPLQARVQVLVYLIGYGLIRYFLQPYR